MRITLLLAFLLIAAAPDGGCQIEDAPATSAEGAAATAAESPARPSYATGSRPTGSGLPVGEYQCWDTYVQIGAATRVTPKEVLIVESESTYRYRAGGPTGEYAYDPATGEVRWLSGPYAGGNPTGQFERRDGQDVITLTYTFERLGTDSDFCIRRTGAGSGG